MVSENKKMEKKCFNKNKKIIFLIKVMCGGGAERVISLLSKAMIQKGYDIILILTHQKKEEADLKDIDPAIQVIALEDEITHLPEPVFKANMRMLYARLLGKLGKVEVSSINKYYARNYRKVIWLKEYFKKDKESTIIAFLYDSIFLTMLSKTSTNRVILSERGDPQQSAASKTTMAFLHKMFPKADNIVFQSPDVSKWYQDNMNVKGTVIFNPIKAALPERFEGIRKKRIVNFCRISDQKNLELLVNAFARLNKDYPEYELFIYGDAVGNGAEGYLDKIKSLVELRGLQSKINILPGLKDIHTEIRDYAMFVSSSDFEGMSNSMLEAMAIGMPVVCTDCPAGGARAVIKDHENGLLVPVKNEEKMYLAMKEIIETPELAEELSRNAVQIRKEQSLEKIIKKWMEIIND